MTKNNKKTVRVHFVDFHNSDHTRDCFCERFLDKYDIVIDEKNPQFLFCGNRWSYDSVWGQHRLYGGRRCCKILVTGENVIPNFNFYDYAIAYAPLKFGDRYLRHIGSEKHRDMDIIAKEWCELSKESVIREKTDFCNFIYSNSAPKAPQRVQFFHLLSQYKKVTSAGRFLRNTDGLMKEKHPPGLPVDYWREEKVNFIKRYKFTIAFENVSSPGYVSEKILHAFRARTVPIYWGNPYIAEDFEPGSFINAHDFESLEALVEEVKRIDQDDEAYLKMLNTYPIPEKYQGNHSWDSRKQAFVYGILDQEPAMAIRRTIVSEIKPLRVMKAYFKWWRLRRSRKKQTHRG